jgi:hypothetical protein
MFCFQLPSVATVLEKDQGLLDGGGQQIVNRLESLS